MIRIKRKSKIKNRGKDNHNNVGGDNDEGCVRGGR